MRTWLERPLGEIVEFLDSQRRPITASERTPGPFPYYGANGVQDYVDGYLFDEPLVLLAEDGGHFDDPERGIAYGISGKSWVNNHAHVLRPRSGIDVRYLARVLENYDARPLLTGSTRAKLTKAAASRMPIPVPPIEEQRSIAAVLDQAVDLRAKRQTSLALSDSLTQSIFLDMFGDPLGNPRGWQLVRLADVSREIQIGPFGSLLHQSDYVQGGVPLVNPMHIVDGWIVPDSRHAVGTGKLAALSRYILAEHDIVMARRGEMGRCAVVDAASAGMVCGSGSLFIRPDEAQIDVRFLHKVLTSVGMKGLLERKALGVTMANLNGGIVGDLPIPLPPLGHQKRFASATALANRQRERLASGARLLDGLFSSIQHHAFAGQL